MMLLDTNIVIYYLGGDAGIVEWLDRERSRGEQFAISTMTVVELLSYQRLTSLDAYAIERWYSAVLVLDVDLAIAREAARLRNKTRLTTIDAIVVATASILNCPLATRDSALNKIKDITVVNP